MRRDEKGLLRETFLRDCLVPQMGMLGWSRFLEARYELVEHTHGPAYEICYIVRGQVDWWAEKSIYAVGPGDLYVTRPNERHGGVDALMHPCELYWTIIHPSRDTGATWQQIMRRMKGVRAHVFPGSPLVPEIFERLLNEHRQPSPDSRQVVA